MWRTHATLPCFIVDPSNPRGFCVCVSVVVSGFPASFHAVPASAYMLPCDLRHDPIAVLAECTSYIAKQSTPNYPARRFRSLDNRSIQVGAIVLDRNHEKFDRVRCPMCLAVRELETSFQLEFQQITMVC